MTDKLLEYQKHVRLVVEGLKTTAWCGVELQAFDWFFTDVDHAALEGRRRGRLLPCPRCLAAITSDLSHNGVAYADEKYFEMHEWDVGHVLTKEDVEGIGRLLTEHNEEMAANVFHYQQARQQVLFEIGGEELAKVGAAADRAEAEVVAQRALKHYHATRERLEATLKTVKERT